MSNGDAFIATCFFATCGGGLSIFLLAFNIKYRSLRFIKMTSPNINVIILASSIGLYGCCVLLTMEPTTEFTVASATALCQVRIWLLTSSVVTYLAAMFAKGWRVSRLFHYSSIRRIVIKDVTLLAIVAALFVGNFALLLLWQLIDPFECILVSTASTAGSSGSSGGGGGGLPSASQQPETTDGRVTLAAASATYPSDVSWPALRVDYASGVSCQSRYFHAWTCALFLYATGVVLSCVVVGWRIRHVRSPSLDDSRCILFTVNSSLLLLAAATWLGGSMSGVRRAAPVVYGGALWAATTLSLCFNFVPKVHAVLKNAGKEPVALGSSKYFSSDLAAERILTHMTAEVSTMLSGSKATDSTCPEATSESKSDLRQRSSEVSSQHESCDEGESAQERGSYGFERKTGRASDDPSLGGDSEDDGARRARIACHPPPPPPPPSPPPLPPRRSRLADAAWLRCFWPQRTEQRKLPPHRPTPRDMPPPPSASFAAQLPVAAAGLALEQAARTAAWRLSTSLADGLVSAASTSQAMAGATSESPQGAALFPVYQPAAERWRHDDLILSIAGTYNLPDDLDTYSYISSWIPTAASAARCVYCPRHGEAPDAANGLLPTIGSDQLYPSVGGAAASTRASGGLGRGVPARRRRAERWSRRSRSGSGSEASRGSTSMRRSSDVDGVVV